MGDSKHPLIFVAIAAFTNLVLDLLFVAVFHWGAAGAAVATVMGQALSLIISVLYLYKKRDAFGFDFRLSSFGIDGNFLKKLLKLGIPFSLQNSAISISMLFVNKLSTNTRNRVGNLRYGNKN